MLKWIFERLDGTAQATKTAIGLLPLAADLDTQGLSVSTETLETLLSVDVDGWRGALPQIRDHFAQFGDALPSQLATALQSLDAALA